MPTESMTLCVSHSPGFARDVEEEHGATFRNGIQVARGLVAEFEPTLVVFFGSDHRRAFTDTVPAFSVVHGAEGMGDLRSPTGPYDVPAELATELTQHLLDASFDVAATRHVALDHGFGLTAADILGGIDVVPTLPIFINCATPPLAPPARAAALGACVGQFVRGLDERVLFIGSGGLSHDPPTLAQPAIGLSEEERKAISAAHRDAAKDRIRPEWDNAFLGRLASEDTSWTREFTQRDIEPAGVGANEVRTWLAAYTAGANALTRLVYEPVREWLTGVGIAASARTARKAA